MQPQYHRNYPQAAPAHRSPHATSTRRGPGPVVPNSHAQQPHLQYTQAQQRAEQQKRELARRQAHHPTDKTIPEGVEDTVIGDGVSRYRQLRDIERTLDATMMRKKMDVTDSVTRSQLPRYGTMRIWISNTAENQPWQGNGMDPESFDFESDVQATYKVKIQGKLLDEGHDVGLSKEDDVEEDSDVMEEDGAASNPKIPAAKLKPFSHFFKSITIDFDRAKSLQPDGFNQIEWRRPENPTAKEASFSELVFERKGDENINITVNLQRFDVPERHRLSEPLARLLDTDEDDRAGIMMGVWEYVKANGLSQDDDERKIRCDANLRAVFNNQDTFFFPHLATYIPQHLQPLPPIQLKYTIRVDKDYISPSSDSGLSSSQPTVYDVRVPLEDPIRPLFNSLMAKKGTIETLQHIHNMDEQIALLVRAISQSKAKHAFFTSMSKDPVNFMKRWISSQRRDLEVILGEANRAGDHPSGDEWRRGGEEGVWGSENAKESVGLWLARQKAH